MSSMVKTSGITRHGTYWGQEVSLVTLISHATSPNYISGKPQSVKVGCPETEEVSSVYSCLIPYTGNSFLLVTLVEKKIALRLGMSKRSSWNSASLPIHAKNSWEEFQFIVCVYALNRLNLSLPTVITWDALFSVPWKQVLLSLSFLKHNPSSSHPKSRWSYIFDKSNNKWWE